MEINRPTRLKTIRIQPIYYRPSTFISFIYRSRLSSHPPCVKREKSEKPEEDFDNWIPKVWKRREYFSSKRTHELSTFSFDRNRKKKEHRTADPRSRIPVSQERIYGDGSRIIPRTDDRPTAYNNVLQHRGQSLGWLGLN